MHIIGDVQWKRYMFMIVCDAYIQPPVFQKKECFKYPTYFFGVCTTHDQECSLNMQTQLV
jgi:hypothetical protein